MQQALEDRVQKTRIPEIVEAHANPGYARRPGTRQDVARGRSNNRSSTICFRGLLVLGPARAVPRPDHRLGRASLRPRPALRAARPG